jgi:hypothetical protein
MKYYRYLKEASINKDRFHPKLINRMENEKLYDILEKNDIFQLYRKSDKNFLYRGVKADIYHYEKRSRRKDRQPKDMPKHLHDLLDYEFNRRFGWKARSEGVFVVPNQTMARGYGTPYIFIPLGKYRFLYSDEISDLFSEATGDDAIFLDAIEVAVLNDDTDMIGYLSEEGYDLNNVPSERDVIDKMMKTYTNKNINNAINLYKHEIMFDCNEYLLFESSVIKQIIEDFK